MRKNEIITKDNRICAGCVEEPFLNKLICDEGLEAICDYCDDTDTTISMEQIAAKIEQAFESHFETTDSEPDGLQWASISDPEIDYEWEREGQQAMWAIADAAEIEEEVAEDIRKILEQKHYDHELAAMGEELPYSEDSYYKVKSVGLGEYADLWEHFEIGLKTEARFFSLSAQKILDEIFTDLLSLRTIEGKPVIIKIGPETEIESLFRARVFAGQDAELKQALGEPWKFLGTPLSRAAGAGRMNARGISVFYGALSAETALSEVRPPVGSKVAVANFKIQRSLKVLDLSALTSIKVEKSIFDPSTIKVMQRTNFLKILSEKMSRSVMPHEEVSEYLPTQATADYLAVFGKLDGIFFPSVQAGHQSANIVIFHNAAKVTEEEFPEGTKFDVQLDSWDDEGTYPDYMVWEEIPQESNLEAQSPPADPLGFHRLSFFTADFDSRESSLRIDLSTIEVHHIQAVTFKTETHDVRRHQRRINPNINKMY